MVKLIQGDYSEVINKLQLKNYKKVDDYDTMLKYKNQGALFGEPPVLVSTSVEMLKYDFAGFNNNIAIIVDNVDKRSKLYKHCYKNKTYYELSYRENTEHIPSQYQVVLNTIQDQNVFNHTVRQLNLLDSIDDEKFYAILGNVGDFNIFNVIDNLIDGESKLFFLGYQSLITQGESPFKIMVLIRTRIEDLLKLSTYQNYDLTKAQQLSGLNYYFVKNNLYRVKKTPRTALIKWYITVVNTQYLIVSGKVEESIAINSLLTELFTPLQTT